MRSIFDAGGWVLLESAIADLPADLRWLFESGAGTIEQLAALQGALGVTSAADLAAEVSREAVRQVDGPDHTVEATIGSVLPTLRVTIPRIPLGRAMTLVHPILNCLAQLPSVKWAQPVGSLRRGQDMVGDIEVVAPTVDPQGVFDEVVQLPEVDRALHRGPKRLYVLIDRVQVGVHCPTSVEAGAVLLHLTGTRRALARPSGARR